jgi:hypothetical protein
MARANRKKLEIDPTIHYELFGFDGDGYDVNIPFWSVIDFVSENNKGMIYRGDYNAAYNTPHLDSTNFVLSGSINPTSSRVVTGVGTLFTTEIVAGDTILVSGETRVVYEVTNNLKLIISEAFSDNVNDLTPERIRAAISTQVGDFYTVKGSGSFYSRGVKDDDLLIVKEADTQTEEGWNIFSNNKEAIDLNTDKVSDLHYTHDQGVPALEWVVSHNLGKYPSVLVVDSAKSIVAGQVTYTDLNTIKITFNASFSGSAYIN